MGDTLTRLPVTDVAHPSLRSEYISAYLNPTARDLVPIPVNHVT